MALGKLRAYIVSLQDQLWHAILATILSIVTVILLAAEVFIPNLSTHTIQSLHAADLAIAYIFLIDFVLGLSSATKRKIYFKHNFLNLLSSIPLSEQTFRALRILRIIRAGRTLRLARLFQAAANSPQILEVKKKIKKHTE